MKKLIVLALILSATSSWAAATDCSQLPAAGAINKEIQLADGSVAVFQATLEIRSTPAYGDESKVVTAHTYRQPQIIVNGKSLVMTKNASTAIAQLLGYEGQELGVLKQNRRLFGEKALLDVQNGSFVLRPAESGEVYQDREGYVIFFHPQCADWRY